MPPENQPQFDFDEEFQYRLCVLLCTDISVLMRFRYLIRPSYFVNEIARQLVAWSYALYDQYHIAPTRATMLDTAAGDPALRQSQNKELVDRWIESLYITPIPDREYILERVSRFCTVQEYTLAVIEAANRIKDQSNVEQIPEIIRNAELRLSVQHGDLGSFALGMDGPTRFDRVFAGPIRDTILTPWPTINTICGGGPGRKELMTFLAPPNVGKSFCLTGISTAAATIGKFVVHVTLEMSEKLTLLRIYAKLSGRSTDVLQSNPYYLDQVVGPYHQQGGEVLVKEFPTGAVDTNGIRDLVLRIGVMTGRMPDMLVIDYADLLDKGGHKEEERHKIARIYRELRGLAVEYNIAVVTASQANRKALGKERITMADIAEAFEKAAISDIIIALCQTEEEETAQAGRFFIAKNRNDPRGAMVPLFLQYNIATISERQYNGPRLPHDQTQAQNLGSYSQFLPNQIQGEANGSNPGNPSQQ